MFQKAAVSLSWQVELLPGLLLKQAIVHAPVNHPEHIQKHRDVVSCELRVQERNQESLRDWLCKWSGTRQLLIMWRPRLCRGLYQCADQLRGACTEDFGNNPHHRPACCSVPLCSLWRKWEGWLAGSTQLPRASSSLSLHSHCWLCATPSRILFIAKPHSDP